MLPTKFGVNWPISSGEEAKISFSRWRPYWISDWNNFSYFCSTSHPDASYQVSRQLDQGCRRSRLLKQLLTPHDERQTTSCSGELKRRVRKQVSSSSVFFNHSQLGLKRPLIYWTRPLHLVFCISVYSYVSHKRINYQTIITDDSC